MGTTQRNAGKQEFNPPEMVRKPVDELLMAWASARMYFGRSQKGIKSTKSNDMLNLLHKKERRRKERIKKLSRRMNRGR
ncbi:hypothetical protein A2Z67_02460 [Candidatus Woesebacteria bacterium RBG_13_36_22]|uniref:Uncharacterized protein n=1 Tax=Candidatus Woesebacteria bacterium RBG_13_36_22 TaxID=1802478 RepID=A0A1F7X1J7_9BACT|nr:MAG: hypothetical protein A2Z67_02460 [Candidatus Woesebacteria bacterium RBG_13_36_22]